jgi:Flp pilus assembly protein TadD
VLAVVAAVFVLGFPYLSVRDVSSASDIRSSNPAGALSLLSRAASLNPLDAEPPRLAGTIALMSGRFVEAERRFAEAAARQPGGWFAWFGQGLAASVLGDSARARQDFRRAAAINNRQVAVTQALARANSIHPLTPSQALSMLVLAH